MLLPRLPLETAVRDLFVDDYALNACREQGIQSQVDSFSSACDNFGLTISIKKTEVMLQPAPRKPYLEPNIMVKGHKLHAVDNFTYLGSTLSCTATSPSMLKSATESPKPGFLLEPGRRDLYSAISICVPATSHEAV